MTQVSTQSSSRMTHSSLAQIAADAALELDCRMRGITPPGIQGVKRLSAFLVAEVVLDQPSSPSSLLSPSVAVAMGSAINSTGGWLQHVMTVDEVVAQARLIRDELEKSNNSDSNGLTRLKGFCLALSKAAADQQRSTLDDVPYHPNRHLFAA